MDQISYYVTTAYVSRERELAEAAEHARVAAERSGADGSRLRPRAWRRRGVLSPTPVTH